MAINKFGDGISWELELNRVLLEDNKNLFYKFDENNEMVKRIRKYIVSTKEKKLLDCGCHMGRWVEFFEKMGFKYTGIEQSIEVFNKAMEYHPNIEGKRRFINQFIWDINFSNEFDIAISIAVLQHNTLGEKKRMIPKIYNALKNGGLFVILESTLLGTTPTQLSHSGWISLMESFGFTFIDSWHTNEFGVEDSYIFRK